MNSLIQIDTAVCSGKPYLHGTRLTVEFLQGLAATGWKREEVLGIYPYMKPEELDAALAYQLTPKNA